MWIEPNAAGDYPRIAESAYIHPSAAIIGNVEVSDGVFIGPQAVIRADEPGAGGFVESITIGEGANVQDGVVIHAVGGSSVIIGARTSIAHGAVVHGPCEIGSDSFVGFNSVVYDTELGDGCIVMHQALVQGVQLPDGLCVSSGIVVLSQEDVYSLDPATSGEIAFVQKVAHTNLIGVGKTGYPVSPPSEPYVRFSRIRLSGR